VAEEEQEKIEEEQAPAKKKRLGAILLVVIGAALGGAGVVFLMPHPEPKPHGPPPADIRIYDYPEPMEFTFNPIVERGHKQARLEFLFSYKADSKDVGMGTETGEGAAGGVKRELPPVLKAIKVNWSRAYSRCLEVLSDQTSETLLDPDGKRRVKRLLIEELSATLFPDGIASVDDILWKSYFVQ